MAIWTCTSAPASPISPIPPTPDLPTQPLCSSLGVRCDNACDCGVCLNALRAPRCFEHSRQWTGRAKNGTYCDHELDPIAASSTCVSTGECNTNARIANCQAAQPAVLSAGFSMRSGGPNSRLALSVYKRHDCACPPARHQNSPMPSSKPRRQTPTNTPSRLPQLLLLLLTALTVALVASRVCGRDCRRRAGCAASRDETSPTLLQPLLPPRHEQPPKPPQLGLAPVARVQLQLDSQPQAQHWTQAVRAQKKATRATCATRATPMERKLEQAGVVRQEPPKPLRPLRPLRPPQPPQPPRRIPGRPTFQRESAASLTTQQLSGVGNAGRAGSVLSFRFH